MNKKCFKLVFSFVTPSELLTDDETYVRYNIY